MKKNILTLVSIVVLFQPIMAQTISIASARASVIGSTVTVQGIVLNGPELGAIRYIDDGTGGIAVYSATLIDNVVQGDIITVTGTTTDYYNLLQLVPSVVLINSSGNPLPSPIVTTIASGYVESLESRLVRIDDILFSTPGASFVGSTNYAIMDGSGSGIIRINNAGNIAGEIIPCGSTSITGIMSQYLAPYQLLPRSIDDMNTISIGQSNITQTTIDIGYKTPIATPSLVEYGTTTALGFSTSNPTLTVDHLVTLSGLSPATLYYVRVTSGTFQSCVIPVMTASTSSGMIKCYFNNSVDHTVASSSNNAHYLNNSFNDTIAAYMDKATTSLDIAIYNISPDPTLIAAINAAHSRGVNVRFLYDTSAESTSVTSLTIPSANIKSAPLSSPTYGIMHNKFIVIDKDSPLTSYVLTGSTNWTYNQLQIDKNNLIIFQDQSIAKAYTMEYEEMFMENKFGNSKTNNTPHEFNIGGKRVEVYFSPSDGVQQQIKKTIKSANNDLFLSLMVFTREDIAMTMRDSVLIPRDVFAQGIVNDTAISSDVYDICITSMEDYTIYTGSDIFHHKYMIVDAHCPSSDPLVLTGSHNWSLSANTKNDENTVIVHDAAIANQYFQEWVQRYRDLGGSVILTANCILATNDHSLSTSEYMILPNPAQDNIEIINKTNETPDLIELYDMSNKLISTSAENKLDISSLNNAMYIIKVYTETKIETIKFIKLNK